MRKALTLARQTSSPGPSAATAAAALLGRVGAAAVVIVPILGLVCMAPHAAGPTPDDPPGSGVVVRTVVTAVWVPRGFPELARRHTGPSACSASEEHGSFPRRNAPRDAWYAVTYTAYQRNGHSAEITQIRRLSELADRADELRDVMDTASGEPPTHDGLDYSSATVVIIPDALLALGPREAVSRLTAVPAVRIGALRGAGPIAPFEAGRDER